MTEWRTWNLSAWNERLLNHFFRGRDERSTPVVVLLATADELVRATGDFSANADEVRDAFVEAVCIGIRRSKSLLEDASDYPGWPGPPASEVPPRFVSHLIFTCVAASESSDELGDERSFVSRLRDLTRDQLPGHSLQVLPRLWEHLSGWLEINQSHFRALTLPDPGGLTRIGYTVKLAFPDRRDQRQLSDLLDRAGLAGHEPPVGRVLSLVASERTRFRSSFLAAFDEFRRLFESSGGRSATALVQHRFWAAVREASLRGRGQTELTELGARVGVLGEEVDDRLALFVTADGAVESNAISFAALPVSYGSWHFAVQPKGCEALEAEHLHKTISALLEGTLRLPRLSSQVEQGFLPFFAAPHGLLELAIQEQLADVCVVLARTQVAAELRRVLGNDAGSTRPSPYSGWVQLHEPRLRILSAAEVEGTSLGRTWILQQALSLVQTRLVGGIRVDDGWLGVREVLPGIAARSASQVVLSGAEGETPLHKSGDTWRLPQQDIAGEYHLLASIDGKLERRAIRFHASPASEFFKSATDPDAWIVESVGGTETLSNVELGGDRPATDFAPLCERVALLGSDVGVFVTNTDAAAWKVVHFAGRYWGARGPLSGDLAVARHQATNANARRRWRKMLFESAPGWHDKEYEEARRRLKSNASTHHLLPRVDVDQRVPDIAPLPLRPPSSATERLVRIIAGRAAARAGIDWREWTELAQRVLDIDKAMVPKVTRAWMEAGLLDVASFARWRHRAVFARLPCLIAFQVGEHVGATLSGLVLPTTMAEIRRAALRTGVLVEERCSVSPLVPLTLSVRARESGLLNKLAAACGLSVRWIDLTRLERDTAQQHDPTAVPPEHYERSSRWTRWSLTGDDDYVDVLVDHYVRRDRPDYWVVSRDQSRLWFYDLNAARGWAAALIGELVVKPQGEGFIEANHAFLPLPVARAVSVLGLGLPGPSDSGPHRYPVGTSYLRELVLGIVSRIFDLSKLTASAS